MAGVRTGPSMMGKIGQFGARATNALAQQYGDPRMRGAAQGASSLFNRPRPMAPPSMPTATAGIQPGQMPGQQMPMPSLPSIQTGPTNQFSTPYSNVFTGYGPSGNTGIAGGILNRPPGYERPNIGGNAGGVDIGGMFSRYGGGGSNPNRRY